MAITRVHKEVQKTYGKIAKSGGSCCGPATCCGAADPSAFRTVSGNIGYSDAEMDAVPDGSNLGLGCGNPTALGALNEGDTVLDLGSGAGFDCFLAARKVGESGRVIGVDMTPAMLERARSNAEKGGFKNVEFREGQIESLPVADGEVDVIISNCVINLSPDKAQVFGEAYRALKPGGRLFVSDIVLKQPLPWFIRRSTAMYSACISGALLESEYLGAMQAAGFTEITIGKRAVYSMENLVAEPGVSRFTRFLLSIPYFRAMAEGVTSLGVSAIKPQN